METHQEQLVSQAWKDHWQHSEMQPDQSVRGRLLRWSISHFGGLSANRYTTQIVLSELGNLQGKKILDAGCGTGLNSLALARRGAEVTLLDISPQALQIAGTYFKELGLQARLIEGSIFRLPFEDATFDVSWNTGVIEHFEPELRRQAIQEMLRVLKPNGTLLTINPSADAGVYLWAKARGEATGAWDVGVELPIATLAGDVSNQTYRIREYRRGWLMQFHFLKYALPKWARLPWALAHELVSNVLNFLNRMPGYLIITRVDRLG
jgi:ubiquinone/menaquinone biosynthesis C-methylase UbiE